MVGGFVAFGMAQGPDERDLGSFVADPEVLLRNGWIPWSLGPVAVGSVSRRKGSSLPDETFASRPSIPSHS